MWSLAMDELWELEIPISMILGQKEFGMLKEQ